MKNGPDRMAWLQRLEPVQYNPDDAPEEASLERMTLSLALLQLADLTHERQFALCSSLAKHLLGHVPGPEDDELPSD